MRGDLSIEMEILSGALEILIENRYINLILFCIGILLVTVFFLFGNYKERFSMKDILLFLMIVILSIGGLVYSSMKQGELDNKINSGVVSDAEVIIGVNNMKVYDRKTTKHFVLHDGENMYDIRLDNEGIETISKTDKILYTRE